MRAPELSPRLRMTAGLVPPGARLADIGTDHGYLPAALLLEGTIPWALAADLRPGPLSRAKETARALGLQDRMAFRLCDGLSGIRPEEIDAAVLAGMGGETIAGILERAPWSREKPVIVQPQSTQEDLRVWLAGHGRRIVREELAREGDLLYTAWLVEPGEMGPLSPAERCAGRNAWHPLREAWLERWLERTERALEGLARARKPGMEARTAHLREVRAGIIEMKEELKQWQP